MEQTINGTISLRKKEIVEQYINEIEKHVLDLKEGNATTAMEINEFAALLHIHPVHLSHTIKEVTGKSTCSIYEHRLLSAAKELLLQPGSTIAQTARQLTYDPSNFTKFFKHYTGITPKEFRNRHANRIKS